MGAPGWVAIHRKLTGHPLWTRQRFTYGQAWVDLILLANYQDHVVLKAGRTVPVARGQVFTTMVELADRWRWNRKTVRVFLEALQRDNAADIQTSRGTDTGYTLITLRNYALYQDLTGRTLDIASGTGADIPLPIETDIPRTSLGQYLTREQGNNPPAPPGTGNLGGPYKTPKGGPEGASASASAAGGNGRAAPKRARRPEAPPDDEVQRLMETYPHDWQMRARHWKPHPNPDVARLVIIYREAVKTKTGSYPVTNGMHSRKAQDLLAGGRPFAEAEWLVREWVDDPPAYFADKGMIGLEHLARAVPQLLRRRAEREGRA
jgi:hypothetical protein